jgi:hypothetical protein
MNIVTINEFAKRQGFDGAVYIGTWKGYDVYEPTFKGEGQINIGPPLAILVKGDNIRLSSVEEAFEIIDEMEIV